MKEQQRKWETLSLKWQEEKEAEERRHQPASSPERSPPTPLGTWPHAWCLGLQGVCVALHGCEGLNFQRAFGWVGRSRLAEHSVPVPLPRGLGISQSRDRCGPGRDMIAF